MIRTPLASSGLHGLYLLVIFSSSALADTIVLHTGERIEAKIIKTNETSVEAEVKVTNGVTDVRLIQKSDIATIEKPDPADAAFEALKAYGPGSNSLTPALYDSAIRTKLRVFLGKYPNNPQVDTVRQMITSLEQEKARVVVGEVKIENEWFTPAELEKQKDQVSATRLFQQMKALAQAGDRIGALNCFGQLEKLYPGGKAYPSAVDLATQLIPSMQREIDTKKIVLANDLAERQRGLSLVPPHEQGPLIAAAAAEDAKVEAALAAAVKAGNKWTPIYTRSPKSVEALQTTTTAEATRLAAISTAPMHASLAAVREAKSQIAAGDLEGADASLKKASTLWAANLAVKDANEALATAKAIASATPGASPAGSTTPLATTPAVSVPVVPPSATPVPPASGTQAAITTTALPKPTSTPAAAPTAVAPIPEEKPFFLLTIPGAASVLAIAALIAGIISFTSKSKNKTAAE